MSNVHILAVIGAPQIVLIVLVVVLLFGGKKIPELMKGLGKGIKEFKSATDDAEPTPKSTSKNEASDKKD